MSILILRASAASSGGGTDPYAMRDPTGSDLYVDFTAGSDGSGSQASPYNTMNLTRWQSLSAGQALWIMNAGGSGAYTPIVLSSMPAGNSSNRITVACYPGHNKTVFNFPSVGTTWGLVYWDIRGIDIRSDQNGIRLGDQNWSGVGGNPSILTHDVRIIDCIGTRASGSYTDNSGLIAGSASSGNLYNIEIVRCVMSGPSGQTGNQALIWVDYADRMSVIGCDLNGSAHPIYYKHTNNSTNQNNIIKNCILRGGQSVKLCVNYLQFLNNAITSPTLNGSDEGGNDVSPGCNWTVSHNTFSDSEYQLDPGTHNGGVDSINGPNTLRNNVWAGTSRFLDNPFSKQGGIDMGNSSDYSACEGTGTQHFYRNSVSRTLSAHKIAFPTQEINGLASTLTFTGTLNSTPGNWLITAGTSAKANASDGTDRGVDSTKLLTVN